MSDWLLAVMIGAAFGLVIGIKVARDSARKEPVRGGTLAQAMNYLGSAGLTSILPFVIAALVIGLPAVQLIGTILGLTAVTFVFLLVYGAVEPPKPPAEEGAPPVLGT